MFLNPVLFIPDSVRTDILRVKVSALPPRRTHALRHGDVRANSFLVSDSGQIVTRR